MGCSWSSSSNAVTVKPPQEEKQYQTSGGGVLSGKYDIKKPSAALVDSTTKVANVPPSRQQQPQPTAPPQQQLHHSPTKPVRIHPTTTVRSSYSPYYDKLPPRAKQCCVHHVYDGDTLTLQNKKRVRFLGMDTPELKNPVQAFSREAKAYTESRCLSSSGPTHKNTIWISYENSSGGEELDKYGRLLAWVWVKTDNNNQYECVNEGLVQEGLASVYVPSKATKLHNMTKLVAMQREARIGKRGMWHTFQDSTVLRTPYGCAYHHPKGAKKCDHLKRSSKETLQYMLESVAMDQGLHACRTCLAEDNNAVNRAGVAVSVY